MLIRNRYFKIVAFTFTFLCLITNISCELFEIVDEEDPPKQSLILYFENTYTRNYDNETYYGLAKIYLKNKIYYLDFNEILEIHIEPGYIEYTIYIKEYSLYYESEYKFYSSSKGYQSGGTSTTYIH